MTIMVNNNTKQNLKFNLRQQMKSVKSFFVYNSWVLTRLMLRVHIISACHKREKSLQANLKMVFLHIPMWHFNIFRQVAGGTQKGGFNKSVITESNFNETLLLRADMHAMCSILFIVSNLIGISIKTWSS